MLCKAGWGNSGGEREGGGQPLYRGTSWGCLRGFDPGTLKVPLEKEDVHRGRKDSSAQHHPSPSASTAQVPPDQTALQSRDESWESGNVALIFQDSFGTTHWKIPQIVNNDCSNIDPKGRAFTKH